MEYMEYIKQFAITYYDSDGSMLVMDQDTFLGISISALMFFFFLSIGIFVLLAVGMWRLFEKAGYPGWASIVPYYNIYVMGKIADTVPIAVALMILTVIPHLFVVELILYGVLIYKMSRCYSNADTIFIIGFLLPGALIFVTGEKCYYIGPQNGQQGYYNQPYPNNPNPYNQPPQNYYNNPNQPQDYYNNQPQQNYYNNQPQQQQFAPPMPMVNSAPMNNQPQPQMNQPILASVPSPVAPPPLPNSNSPQNYYDPNSYQGGRPPMSPQYGNNPPNNGQMYR